MSKERERMEGNEMTPKEWAIKAFDSCDHGGLICMSCVEKAVRGAIEEDRTRVSADNGLPHEIPAPSRLNVQRTP